jgi:hypothetical protein
MKDKATLSIRSLLSILFFALHWADDIVRGIATGGVSGLSVLSARCLWGLNGT